MFKQMSDILKVSFGWETVRINDRKSANAYYINSVTGDRKAIKGGGELFSHQPLDMDWLSEAEGKAIIVMPNAPVRIVAHEDLHSLKSALIPPVPGSYFDIVNSR